MFAFYEKRKLRRVLYSRPMLVLLAIPVILLGMAAWNAYGKERETSINREEQTRELAALEEREGALQAEMDRLKVERGVEEEVRSKYDMGKPGEHMIVIVDPDQKNNATTSTEEHKGWFQRFLDWW